MIERRYPESKGGDADFKSIANRTVEPPFMQMGGCGYDFYCSAACSNAVTRTSTPSTSIGLADGRPGSIADRWHRNDRAYLRAFSTCSSVACAKAAEAHAVAVAEIHWSWSYGKPL